MPRYPQRDAELFRLQEKQKKCQAERKALAIRIEELDREIAEVQAEYGAVYNEPAPFLTLSTEVTCLIFDFMVAAGFITTGETLTDQDKRQFLSEVIVSQVCRQWRSISLAYPALWTHFCHDGPRASRVPLDRFDAYLERSASQPLELWFDFRGSADREWTLDGQLALFQRSIPAIARWKCFTVLSDPTTPVDTLLSEMASLSAQNLEHFVFRPNLEANTDDSSASSIQDFAMKKDLETTVFKNGAPKLKSLTLDCSSVAYTCLPPLSNITTLRLEAPYSDSGTIFSWAAFREILSISSLENLSLVGPVLEDLDFGFHPVELITMNSLKHLRFGNLAPLWLPFLRAPLLATLIIRKCWMPNIFGYHERLQAEPYAFPALQSLYLLETSAQTLQMAHYFARMTGLATDIAFSQETDTDSFSSFVLEQDEDLNETYWTKAVQITSNSNRVDFHRIVRFVRARRTNNITLRIIEQNAMSWIDGHSLLPNQYKELTEICTLEILHDKNIDNALWKRHWQFGGYRSGRPMEDDSEDLFAME
ncbi:hypothetical protein GALMADRAFT_221901 [Galerina marginata CBS 339.88]|uniref:F-box domain-containing protein n=1 Tax=Galerina marginata (strain CBS 339.88) TaxID=685588 RepID=A0A067TI62_GALM3|nr:hypothetical protein GALMADRAFT_221901 [Galerina marginata CBS 339.88]